METPKKKAPPAVAGEAGRIVVLDGLRGYAIMMVMCHHFFLSDAGQYQFVALRWVVRIFQSGWIGVDLFFILSGFLITNGLLESRDRPRYFLNFYSRRTLRIFPLYYGVLFCAFVIIPLFSGQGSRLLGNPFTYQGWLWLYLTNFAIVIYGRWDIFTGPIFHMAHFWTLAVEEHFYLVWPLLIRFLRERFHIAGCLVVIAVALGTRFWILMTEGNDSTAAYILTYCRIDTLAMGALVAVLVRQFGIRRLLIPALIGITLGALMIIWLLHNEYGLRATGSHIYIFNYTLLAVFFASLLVLVIVTQGSRIAQVFLGNRFVVAMGKYSYGLYVYHGFITGIFSTWITVAAVHRFVPTLFLSSLVRGGVWMAVAFACAFVSWHGYEKHWLKLKRRFQRAEPIPK